MTLLRRRCSKEYTRKAAGVNVRCACAGVNVRVRVRARVRVRVRESMPVPCQSLSPSLSLPLPLPPPYTHTHCQHVRGRPNCSRACASAHIHIRRHFDTAEIYRTGNPMAPDNDQDTYNERVLGASVVCVVPSLGYTSGVCCAAMQCRQRPRHVHQTSVGFVGGACTAES